MNKFAIRMLLASAIGAVPAVAHAQGGTVDAAKCQAMKTGNPMQGDYVGARWVAATETAPAYCEVRAVLSPAKGSTIGVMYRLPESWNGKLLGLGGGGWAGNVTLGAAMPGLRAGYATAQTDGGHAQTGAWDNDWSSSPEALTDFAYRAINQMTVGGKALVKAFYGKAQDKAYFQGCSTGGRMALMEAQRFPEDYDAIIAQAPVYSLQVQTSAVLRNQVLKAGGGFTPAQLKLANDAVLKACDAKDGLADGVIAAPRQCDWSPKVLACAPGQDAGASCLSAGQVTALETLYAGIRQKKKDWAMLPLAKGSETGWIPFIATDGSGTTQASGGGMPGLSKVLFGDRTVDFNAFDAEADVTQARTSAFGKAYEANNPDLSAFIARGGKLLLWHGESDPGPSPVGTVDYYQAMLKKTKSGAAATRLFLAPGVGHCAGGPGADQVNYLAALDDWVTSGTAPETLVATKINSPVKRTLCAFPQVARYKGEGDANDPANHVCEAPAPARKK
jgi:feruloyl esterase